MSGEQQPIREHRAWLVRAGSNGEREDRALGEGLAIIGWHEMGDLSQYRDWSDLIHAVRSTYPNQSRAVVGNWAGQLQKFDTEIAIGDLVVMRLKTRPGYVAVGRVSGPYEFRANASEDFRQVRRVDWLRTDVPWESIRSDLRASLGSLLTVCELARHNAVERIVRLAEGDKDPGFAEDEEVTSSTELLEDAADRDLRSPRELTIRSLLEHWGAERRTAGVVSAIKADLAGKGLTTRPPFTEGELSSTVAIIPLGTEPNGTTVPADQAREVEDVTEPVPVTRRLNNLPAKLQYVSSTDDLTRAITIMVRNNYSQVAVIDENGAYHGAVTWESIGKAHVATDRPTLTDAIVRAPVVDHDALLLDQIRTIYDNGFVFVYAPDRQRVTGILTASDLTEQSGTLARPFILVEEAENRLRRALEPFFFDHIKPKLPPHMRRRVTSIADLTFGNYVTWLTDKSHWAMVGWRLDHGQFIDLLETVRRARNDLMHFSPDPLSSDKEAAINGLLELLRTVDPQP
ncbi:CBS domain-containing protein [Nocardia terpenica]|uniref:CBS domain-containing protein n=1 Tax=Nocardia terpenica TaxID=455432 RepID=UPI0018938794|nr:CBS domain-containing protein [Nocardia terpenica]MBF6061668.1 CBS domain-containing protein [Nocardia terpenica]MBF6107537.1 CBS domain-containing protein [Nocardia terpenica]MBF6110088.1 CBS domain-containing protein [Nocardia terpenica]MBF6122400.1 CBS domain-containing protein [Nocardia terpenica]MBF6151424.1 CBS domain-containing protein [Nocardia terpenica]